nr:nuclear transport factor 2 family protein [Bradyrhizobium sp. 186]
MLRFFRDMPENCFVEMRQLREEDIMRIAPALLFCLLTAAPAVSFAADAKNDVEKAYAACDAAFNKQDAKALAADYVSTAKLLPPTYEVSSGPAEIEKFWSGLFAAGVTGHKLEVIDAGGDDKIIFASAKWSATDKDKEGKPAPLSGIAVHVFERQGDGSLKLRLQTFN